MIGAFSGFAGFAQNAARQMASDPWNAIGVLDDVVGSQNAKALLPLVAYSAGKAQRGEKMATLASGSVGLLAFPTMTNLTTGMLRLVAPSVGGPVAWLACTIGGIVLANKPNEWLRNSVFRGVRELQSFDRNIRRLEFGGRYEDTATARAMRMAAVQEMNATHQAARAYLGREALLMHR